MTDEFHDPLPGVPRIESPFFSELFGSDAVDEETRRIATELHTRGYAVIDFPEQELDAIADAIKTALHPGFAWRDWLDRGYDLGSGLRVQDAWTFDENVRRLATNSRLLELLTRLYGRSAWPFQTLNFPVGTQQHYHSDAVHFSSIPERFMCGVWIALEDIDADSGPLVYYPGSHSWPVYTNEHLGNCAADLDHLTTQEMYEPLWEALVETHGAKPEVFLAKKGQALIWAANLLHGGEQQRDKHRTRWSQVTHYFFEDCAYWTPMRSDPFYGKIDFRSPVDVRTGEVVENRYLGRPLPPAFVASVRPGQKRLPDDFDKEAYLRANPDVARAGMDAAEHWLMYGMHEGRKLRP